MVDWYAPTVLQEYAKTAAAVLDTALKLLDRLRRRTENLPADKRELGQEVDELRADLEKVAELMTTALANETELWTAVVNLVHVAEPPDVPEDQRPLRLLAARFADLRELQKAVSTRTGARKLNHTPTRGPLQVNVKLTSGQRQASVR